MWCVGVLMSKCRLKAVSESLNIALCGYGTDVNIQQVSSDDELVSCCNGVTIEFA